MNKAILSFIAFLFCCNSQLSVAASVNAVRVWQSPEGTRIVLDLSAKVNYRLFTLSKPDRLVVDIDKSQMQAQTSQAQWKKTLVKDLRFSTQDKNRLRLVLDLKRSVQVKSFTLRPNQQYGNRLVIDLLEKAHNTVLKLVDTSHKHSARRMTVVAIDAGHGGEDPGAIGWRKTKEKDVVLAIARHLAHRVENHPAMHALLIRDGDYYIGLRQRVQKARMAKADLFISIHADAFKDSRAKGSSVFTLSRHGASSAAARWLAARENQSDLIGGVSLDDKDDLLASVLLDLSQTASSEASLEVGHAVLSQVKSLSRLHSHQVQYAGFAVLKAPDIPSILIETGFISNPSEERKLASRHYQNKMAGAIFQGVEQYFKHRPPVHHEPPVLRVATQNYKIMRGDTLSSIAHHFGVTVKMLRHTNHLLSDRLLVGQEIRIPTVKEG